jgi:hypothetical protein
MEGEGEEVHGGESFCQMLFAVPEVTLPSERVAHKRTGFGLSSGWR